MNKCIFTLITLISAGAIAQAHLPKWMIEPLNDTIFVKVDNKLLQTEADGNTVLWSLDGRKLYSTDNKIFPFHDGVATVMSNKSEKLVGVVDEEGNYVVLPELTIAYDSPFFEDGYLLVKTHQGYDFYDKSGNRVNFPAFVKAYPFNQGFASYLTYENIEKSKDPYYSYLRADRSPQSFTIVNNGKEKPLEAKDIEFLSSISDNGKGIAVIKNKYYWFEPENGSFKPILWGDEEQEKRRHLNVGGDYSQYFLNLPADTVTLAAKYGKNQYATLTFDPELKPVSITFGDGEITFGVPAPQPYTYSSGLSKTGNGPYGLTLNGTPVLPEQFDEVGLMYGNNVIVRNGNKWGVLSIIPDIDYVLKVNKGEDVAFRHQKFETQMRLDLPSIISANTARVEIDESTGLVLDRTSRESKDTESGNFVTYSCVLNIPESLPDTISTITYSPVKISYDGVTLFDTPLKLKAWHLKYYNVDPIESETTISNGVASFTLNVNAQRNMGEGDYPFDVRIEGDNLDIEFEKLSETRYKCIVSNLAEGNNNLNIIVTEKGCPPSIFPFDVYYTKPKSRTKEEVVVRKKTPSEVKSTPKIEL